MHPSTPPSPSSGAPASHSPRHRISEFMADASFPCVGAKSALHKDRMRFASYGALGDPVAAADLCTRLHAFSQEFPDPGNVPVSFVATFAEQVADEAAFETALWNHLQVMHEHDRTRFAWDDTVASDPSEENFSLSIGGRAFFVVGLHPSASRLARRAPFPCLVFNFHNQFEALKASGKYQTMQTAIRARDVQLQGSVNPVLAAFGQASEARQYSGRKVDSRWRCPFQTQGVKHA